MPDIDRSDVAQRIVDLLEVDPLLDANELSERLKVDGMTVRAVLYEELADRLMRDDEFRWTVLPRGGGIPEGFHLATERHLPSDPTVRTTFLQSFLLQRGLNQPDGRPLYAYRCSDEEFQAVESLARLSLKKNPSTTAAAFFVLYAAEWWRRNHVGGPWKWEPILEAVDLTITTIGETYPFVNQGLAFWKRQLLRNAHGRMFLVTLACEGGLPLQLIRRDSARLKVYFRRLLENYGLFSRFGASAVDLARALDDELPTMLRQDVVFELSARLIESIWEFQGRVRGEPDPILALDRIDPNWRDQLPLHVTDEVLEAFLRNLVSTAAQLRETGSVDLRFVRWIRRLESQYQLFGELSLPPSMPASAFASRFSIPVDRIPTRGELVLLSSAGETRRAALVTLIERQGDQVCRLERLPSGAEVLGSAVADGWTLVFESLSVHGAPRNLRGGEVLSRELPWVFGETEDGIYRFLGQGSVRTRFPHCLVAALLMSVSLEPAGFVADNDRSVYQVSSETVFSSDDGSAYKVRPGEQLDELFEVALHGELFRTQTDEREVFRGAPTLHLVAADGRLRPIPREDLSCRLIGERSWKPWSGDALGRVVVRVADTEGTRFQQTMDIVPADFSVALRPVSLKEGVLDLASSSRFKAFCEPQDDLSVEYDYHNKGVTIVARCGPKVPGSLRTRLAFENGGSVTLSLPFPSRGARFIGHSDFVLRHENVIRLNELAEYRAEAFGPSTNDEFWIEGDLFAFDVPTDLGGAFYAQLDRSAGGRCVIELRKLFPTVRSLFSQSMDTDARIELRLRGPNVGPSKIILKRFDHTFDVKDKLITIRNDVGEQPFRKADYQIEALRIWDPGSGRHVMPYDEELGKWSLDLPDEAGPWLLFGSKGSSVTVRPKLIERSGVAGGRSALQAAIALEPKQAKLAIQKEMKRLAREPLSEDWAIALSTLELTRDLPAASLFVAQALAANRRAAVVALCLAADDRQAIWDVLESLPFEWYLVGVRRWIDSLERWSSELRDISADYALHATASLLEFLESSPERRLLLPLFDCLRSIFLIGSQPQQVGQVNDIERAALSGEFASALQTLLHARDRERWPFGSAIKEHVKGLSHGTVRTLAVIRQDVPGYKQPVIWAPIIAVDIAATGARPSPELLLQIRTARRFDPEFFDRCFAVALRLMLPDILNEGAIVR